jgi:hypothetical protein
MNQPGQSKRQRALRHAAPERVREVLHAYRRRAGAHATPPAPARSGARNRSGGDAATAAGRSPGR